MSAAEPGAVIRLEPGEYVLDESLRLTSEISIEGAGIGETVIVGRAAGSPLLLDGAGPFSLSGMTIRNETGVEVPVVSASDAVFTLDDVSITGGIAADDEPRGGIGLVASGASDADVSGSEISGNEGMGIALLDEATLRVASSEIAGNGGSGIQAIGGAEASVSMSVVSGNGGDGIHAADDAAVTLEGTTVAGNARSGLQLSGCSSASVSGAELSRNGLAGIVLFGTADAVVEGSELAGNTVHGIQVTDEATLTARDDDISSHRSASERHAAGVAVIGTSGTTVTGCRFTDNEQAIAVGVGVTASATGNAFTGNDADLVLDVVFESGGEQATTTTAQAATTTTVVPAVLEGWMDVELPDGAPYEDYEVVYDDTGRILAGLPTAWSEHRSGPFTHDGEPHGFSLTASHDVDAFIGGHDTPGVFIGAATDLDIGVEEWLGRYDLSDACTYEGRYLYDTDRHLGLMDRWVGCGDAGAVLEILIAEPKDADGILTLQMRSLTQSDREALRRMLLSFLVDFG